MSLSNAIERNRKREARRDKYERLLRRLRQRVFDYEDMGLGDKCSRLIRRCKDILAPRWEAQAEARRKARTDRMMRTWE